MSVVIFFGDNDLSIAENARECDPDAYLIDSSNYESFLIEKPNNCVCYTSLADLTKNLSNVVLLLSKADTVIYSPPKSWSDRKKIDYDNITNSLQGLTETLLLYLSSTVKIINLDLCLEQKYHSNLADKRKTDTKQLWIAGCSVSHGVGVNDSEKYGILLSEKLNLPCSFLTSPGSSIQWAATQILNSDLRAGDILCWGLTSFSRVPFYYQNKLQHIVSNYYDVNKNFNNVLPIELLASENTLFQNLELIRAVINFCDKIEVQLVMFDALIDHTLNRALKKEKHYYQFQYALNNNVGTHQSHGFFRSYDLGSDNQHPGPNTHQKYFKFLSQIIDTKSVSIINT